MSERVVMSAIIDPPAFWASRDPSDARVCFARAAADRLLAAGYRKIPTEGTAEWEALLERVANAMECAEPQYSSEALATAAIRAFKPGGSDE
jgi:hypothetical protein